MPTITISEVASQVGLRPSAIRYYERIGLLPSPLRKSGQRRYGPSVLNCLAVIRRARQAGFTLGEIRELFYGFRGASRASERWQELSRRKLAELDGRIEEIREMRDLLVQITQDCQCETLDQCGQGIFRKFGLSFKARKA